MTSPRPNAPDDFLLLCSKLRRQADTLMNIMADTQTDNADALEQALIAFLTTAQAFAEAPEETKQAHHDEAIGIVALVEAVIHAAENGLSDTEESLEKTVKQQTARSRYNK